MSYKHISSEDWIVIDTLLSESRTKAYIARRLGVNRSTIGREIKRNASKSKPKGSQPLARPKILDVDGRRLRGSGFTKTKYEALDTYNKTMAQQAIKHKYYYGGLANKRVKTRHKIANRKRLKLVHGSGSFLEEYVLKQLQNEQWSPEQVAGRLAEDYAICQDPEFLDTVSLTPVLCNV